MAKIILSFAIAFFVIATASLTVSTVFYSVAEAGCISCDYVPSVAKSPAKASKAKRYKKKRKARSTKKRVVKRKTTAKKVETKKTAPIKTETDSQNSTISAGSLDNDETVEKNTVETVVEPKDESAATREIGCKKYFPTAGQTLTVPCE